MGEKSHRYHPLLISICLAAGIVAVYRHVYNYDFVKYDDDIYVVRNTNIQSGLNLKSIRWAFTSGYAGNWHPVTWLSHMLDYQLFKDRAGGHHLVNVLFHILNTLILFFLLTQMTGAVWPSAFVAAAFALHPLHVESVAWIAERKDILSTFFWLLTMWTYVRYVRNLKVQWYLPTFVLFILGLMSKPMLVTVPFVLLLLDYWPLERKISRRLLIEKIPFFICSFVSCIITFLVQQHSGAIAEAGFVNLKTRISNAVVSYITYIIKMFWPGRLALFYPHPGSGLSTTTSAAYALVLLLVSIYLLYKARRYKFLAVGWLWYLGTMIPVIGLVQVGKQAMADRYTYMTLTGLFIIIAWGAKELIPQWRSKNIVTALLGVIILTGWGIIASRQAKHWENSLSLFGHTLQALRICPNSVEANLTLGITLNKLKRFNEAIEAFNKVLESEPDNTAAHGYLCIALAVVGQTDEAIKEARLFLIARPNNIEIRRNLGILLEKNGQIDEAVKSYRTILEINPNEAETRQLLQEALKKQHGR